MSIQNMFREWLDITIQNREKKLFNEIQKELDSEILFAQMNGFDSLEWCHACKLGICDRHFTIDDPEFFIQDDSYGIEAWN